MQVSWLSLELLIAQANQRDFMVVFHARSKEHIDTVVIDSDSCAIKTDHDASVFNLLLGSAIELSKRASNLFRDVFHGLGQWLFHAPESAAEHTALNFNNGSLHVREI